MRPLESRSTEDSIDSLLELIDELFETYENEADDWRAESIEFSLPELLSDIVKMFGERAEERGLTLALHNSATTPWLVSGDRDCLRQLLVNLLARAVKSGEQGTIAIRTTVTEETSRRALVRFTIEAMTLNAKQEPFGRPAMAPAEESRLAVPQDSGSAGEIEACRRLVEHLGGTLEFDAGPERGSAVSFSIVLDKAARVRWAPLVIEDPHGRTQQSTGQSLDAIHVQSLLDRCFGDSDFCTLMLRKFSHRAGDQMAALDRAAHSGNALELARQAHTLKGLAGNLSAAPLQISADRLEQVARRSDLHQAGSLVDDVRDQMDRCMQEIPLVLARISRR